MNKLLTIAYISVRVIAMFHREKSPRSIEEKKYFYNVPPVANVAKFENPGFRL